MERVCTPELLDTDLGSPDEVASSLADLRLINRYFGGRQTTRRMVERVARTMGTNALSLLEVAAGSGDVPRWTGKVLGDRGIQVKVTLLDRVASHVGKEGRSIVGDAMALPFRANSFDVVSCGLFAHHLLPEQVIQFVDEAIRVARRAVLINDLIRHPLHLAMVYGGWPLYRSRLTRHDAPASVRQAYTIDEMRALLQKTTAVRVDISRYYLFRMGAIAWKV